MQLEKITLELLSQQNIDAVRTIHREDISEAWVDTADTLMELTQYGLDHNCIGHTYAVKYEDTYIGVILLGEAILWETDPEEMSGVPFYRLMGFVIDNRYRCCGIGSYVLEKVISNIYKEYGVRPIALGVHKDNHSAGRFYEKHGFKKTNSMEGNDYYYLRYPVEYIAESNRIGFVQYTHDDDKDMLYCWQDRDTQKGYNHVFAGGIEALSGIDIAAFPFWVVVVDKASNTRVGVLRLSSGEDQDLAIWIYPEYRGKGYGTQAFSLAVDYVFRHFNLRTIYAGCYYDNMASLRMLEKAGFVRYPQGDQQEKNCFSSEPTTQLSFAKAKDMERLELYIPKVEDLWFYQKMMSDPATMSYNAGWDVDYDGYHRDTGCIDYPDEVLPDWYADWVGQEPERFYAYIKRSSDGAWIGDVNFHHTPEQDWWDMGIVIYAPYRGKGYAVPSLKLLLDRAFRVCGISRLHNDFETTRDAAWKIHRKVGFKELGVENGLLQLMLTKEDYLADNP